MIRIAPAVPLVVGKEINANNGVIGYHNLVSTGNVTATTQDANFPATNLANPSTFDKWVGASATEQYLTVGVGEAADYLAVAKPNFASAAIAVSVEGDSGAGFVELISPAIPPDDKPLIFRFASAVYQSIRLRMQAGEGPPQAAVLYVGRILVLQRRIYVPHTPLVYGRRTDVVNGMAERGNFVGRIVRGESRESEIDLQDLTPDWYRANFEPFLAAAQEYPFFTAWRPGTYPNECGFGWLTADAVPQNQRSNGMMRVSLQIAGIA